MTFVGVFAGSAATNPRRPQPQRLLARPSGSDDVISDRVAHQLRNRVAIELPHDVGAVRLGGFHAQTQHGSHFLAALSLRQ